MDIKIRKFELKDRPAIRKISHDTALMGDSAALFFDGEEIISDALTLYFTDYEPESCFVAEADAGVVGFLLGAKDKLSADKVLRARISLGLFWKTLKNGTWLKKKNLIFLAGFLRELIGGGFRDPDFSRQYPATLHINIQADSRGANIGSQLMRAYLDYLKSENIRGVHLATMSEKAANFFSQQGFSLLYKGKRSYFRSALHKDVPLYIYGKKL